MKNANALKARENDQMANIPTFMETDRCNAAFDNCFDQEHPLSRLRNSVEQLIEKFDKIVFEEKLFRGRRGREIPIKFVETDAEGRGGWTDFTINRKCKAEIVLNLEIITTGERLRDILIQETCHVAQTLIDCYDGDDYHGKEWQKWAEKANLVLPQLNEITAAHIPTFMETDRCNAAFDNCFDQEHPLSRLRNFVEQLIEKFDKIVFEEKLHRGRRGCEIPIKFVETDAEGRGGWTDFTIKNENGSAS